MSRPEVKEHNATTNEIIVREMNDEEYQAYLDNQKTIEAYAEKLKADEIARAALLARMGLTADEAKLLLS